MAVPTSACVESSLRMRKFVSAMRCLRRRAFGDRAPTASSSGWMPSRLSFSDAGLTMRRALIGMMSSTTTRSFAFSVLPLLTRSTMSFGQAHERCQFHRPVELDQVDVHSLRREVFACGGDVFRRDAQPGAALDHFHVIEAGPVAITRRQRPMPRSIGWSSRRRRVEEHVPARDPQIGGAVLDDVGTSDARTMMKRRFGRLLR